jgi:HlyD family secretion protein
VIARQQVDDAQARYDSSVSRVNALQKAFELVKIGPRQEQIAAFRGQVEQAKGAVAYAETALRTPSFAPRSPARFSSALWRRANS